MFENGTTTTKICYSPHTDQGCGITCETDNTWHNDFDQMAQEFDALQRMYGLRELQNGQNYTERAQEFVHILDQNRVVITTALTAKDDTTRTTQALAILSTAIRGEPIYTSMQLGAEIYEECFDIVNEHLHNTEQVAGIRQQAAYLMHNYLEQRRVRDKHTETLDSLTKLGQQLLGEIDGIDNLRQLSRLIPYALLYTNEDLSSQLRQTVIDILLENPEYELMHPHDFYYGQYTEGMPTNQVLTSLVDACKSKEQREKVLILIEELLAKIAPEISPDIRTELFQTWNECSRRQDGKKAEVNGTILMGNLSTIYQMEQRRKHSVRDSYTKFGIRNFGRYPIEILLNQLEKKWKKFGVGVFTLADHNEAFSTDKHLLGEFASELSPDEEGFIVIEGGDREELTERVNYIIENFGQAEFGILGGHGTAHGIEYSSPSRHVARDFAEAGDDVNQKIRLLQQEYDYERSHLTVDTIQSGFGQVLDSLFVDDAHLSLFSCSTGADQADGEPGFAQVLSANSHMIVSAPNIPTSIKNLKLVRLPNGRIGLDVTYRDNCRVDFKSGRKVLLAA